jgi:thiol-disulfide isomerase/thioredoxin
MILAVIDAPAALPLVAFDANGAPSPITVQDLVEGAKRRVSRDNMPTYTLHALAHYEAINSTWKNAAGEEWSLERLVELQMRSREWEGPHRGAARKLALDLALRKYCIQHQVQADEDLPGIWQDVANEIRRCLESEPQIRSRVLEQIVAAEPLAVRELQWRIVALPAERLHDEWVIKAVGDLAALMIAGSADSSTYHAAGYTLRKYRERELALADQPNAASAEGAAAVAEATEQAVPPRDVAADEVAGVVVDADGKPLADVLVDVWHWVPGNETRTDEHGVFRLKGIDSKERAEVRITKDGYTPAYYPQQPVGIPGWTVVLTDKTYIEGVVTGADGEPAAGAEIRAAFGPVEGDGVVISEVMTIGKVGVDGKYRLYLKPDTYDIQISAPGQGVKRLSGVVVEQDRVKSLSLVLEPGVRFEARVVDSESGEPVEGFILWQWRPPYLFGRSDAEGRIVFDDLVPGTIEIDCGGGEPINYNGMRIYRHGPFGRWWSEQAVNEWERKHIDNSRGGWQRNFDSLSFNLQVGMAPVKVVVERGVEVSGRATDPDGNPVAGATVAPARTGSGNSLTGDTRYSVKTEEDGTYAVVLPASNQTEYNLIVHDGEYGEWRQWANGVHEPMQTKPGQVIENHDLQLTQPAVIRGRVTFAGKPAANREVRTHAFDKLENRYYDPTTTTDADGRFELKFVRPGKHYLQVEPFYLSAEEAPQGTRIIEVEAGQVLEGQDLVAGRLNNEPSPSLAALQFQARVVDPEGTPIAGASAGIGLAGGAPHYLISLQEHYAKHFPTFSPPPLPQTDAEGLVDLDLAVVVQSRQSVAWIYAVDPAGQRAGTVLLNLDDYGAAEPAAEPVVIDVPVTPVEETVMRFNFDAIPAQALAENERVMMVSITREGMPLQRLLANDEDLALLLPEGDYQIETYDWYAQRVQSTWNVAAGTAAQITIDLQPSRLGSLIGQPAPEFTELKPANVANPTLAGLKGQVVILDFWGHWCGPCIASMPNLMQLHDDFHDHGVTIVAVHDDSVESYGELQTIMERLQNEHWQGRAIPFPVVLDGGGEIAIEGSDIKVNGATTASYGIMAWPTTLVIDRDGRIVGPLAVHDVESARKRLEEIVTRPVR